MYHNISLYIPVNAFSYVFFSFLWIENDSFLGIDSFFYNTILNSIFCINNIYFFSIEAQ